MSILGEGGGTLFLKAYTNEIKSAKCNFVLLQINVVPKKILN